MIYVTCDTTYDPPDAQELIDSAQERYPDILRHFWISEVLPALSFMKEEGAAYDLSIRSGFFVQWNKDEGSEFVPIVPHILYEIFGRDHLLVWNLNHEPILEIPTNHS